MSNPSIQKALALNLPYLSFPTLSLSSAFESLKTLEYSNPKVLVEKIEQAQSFHASNEFQNARSAWADTLCDAGRLVTDKIIKGNKSSGLYKKELEIHESLAKNRLEEFTQRSLDDLKKFLRQYIFKTEPVNSQAENSRFFYLTEG